ncbi:MAG TPA: flagellar motor switch protein FliN [Pirellulaceae bacterium]|nr:flagellar motor switch protein FliN [Pirellulaceae bacterium]
MAGESPNARQEDIEELLRQAQMAAGLTAETAPASSAGKGPEGAQPATSDPPPAAEPAQPGPAVAVAEPPRHSRPAAAPPAAGSMIGDDIQLLIAHAQQAIASVDRPEDPGIPGLAAFALKDLTGSPASGEKATLELLQDVDLDLRIELGRTRMYLEDVLKLKRGSVVALDKLAGEPVDVYVNGRMVARGEVLVLNDNFCVRVTELVTGDTFE